MGINLKFYQAEEFNNMALKNKEEPRVLAIILGGGKGTRLYPLTKERSKPAVPFGGKYRIVDIPISNCINSGYKKIYLLTQFNSASLHLHINNSYNFDRFSDGFVEILAAAGMKEQQMQYPVNVAKVNAGKILEKDGYYCFMILGQTDDTSENDDDAAKFAEKQIDIGVKAFDNYFA